MDDPGALAVVRARNATRQALRSLTKGQLTQAAHHLDQAKQHLNERETNDHSSDAKA